jgi:hypothetical protein
MPDFFVEMGVRFEGGVGWPRAISLREDAGKKSLDNFESERL